MATLVIGFVVGLVFALWVSIGVRLVRRSADGSAFGHDLVVRAEAERGLRELQRYLARS